LLILQEVTFSRTDFCEWELRPRCIFCVWNSWVLSRRDNDYAVFFVFRIVW
jgi:hypothetical protein